MKNRPIEKLFISMIPVLFVTVRVFFNMNNKIFYQKSEIFDNLLYFDCFRLCRLIYPSGWPNDTFGLLVLKINFTCQNASNHHISNVYVLRHM